jgi:hypothetical protein
MVRRISMLALVVFGAALGLAGSANAEPRSGADRGDLRRQLVDLQRRAHELDEKIRHIEAELTRTTPSGAGASHALLPAIPSAAADCKLPVYIDSIGIRHVRLECIDAASVSCDPPYALDEHGVRRFRPACETGAPAPSNLDE